MEKWLVTYYEVWAQQVVRTIIIEESLETWLNKKGGKIVTFAIKL